MCVCVCVLTPFPCANVYPPPPPVCQTHTHIYIYRFWVRWPIRPRNLLLLLLTWSARSVLKMSIFHQCIFLIVNIAFVLIACVDTSKQRYRSERHWEGGRGMWNAGGWKVKQKITLASSYLSHPLSFFFFHFYPHMGHELYVAEVPRVSHYTSMCLSPLMQEKNPV